MDNRRAKESRSEPSVRRDQTNTPNSIQSRKSHKSLRSDGNRKPSSRASSRLSSRLASEDETRSGSPTSQRSLTPLASQRSGSPRTVSPSLRTVSPTVPVSGSNQHSRKGTPRTSSRASPAFRESKCNFVSFSRIINIFVKCMFSHVYTCMLYAVYHSTQTIQSCYHIIFQSSPSSTHLISLFA